MKINYRTRFSPPPTFPAARPVLFPPDGISDSGKTSRKNWLFLCRKAAPLEIRHNLRARQTDKNGNSGSCGGLFRIEHSERNGLSALLPEWARHNTSTCLILSRRAVVDKTKTCYYPVMFTLSLCAAGCGQAAITGSNLCFAHQGNPELETIRIADYITEHKIIADLNAQMIHFENIDFSRCQFDGCNFKQARFSMCVFTGTKMRMSFFDFADFSSCDFSKSDLQFLSFAGSRIHNCTFEGSELLHLNFLGTSIFETTFDNSNLYNSRFINSTIMRSDFINCNLKRVNFHGSRREEINFKSSNTAEALFEMGDE